MLGLFVLFGGYFAINHHYVQRQQIEIDTHQKACKLRKLKSNEAVSQTQPQAPLNSALPISSQTTQTAQAVSTVAMTELSLTVSNPSDLIIKKLMPHLNLRLSEDVLATTF